MTPLTLALTASVTAQIEQRRARATAYYDVAAYFAALADEWTMRARAAEHEGDALSDRLREAGA